MPKAISSSKEHPAKMPKLAWQMLIRHLMAENGYRHQYLFADEIDVCHQTMSRWLGEKPPLPGPESFSKVATFFDISEEELAVKWLHFMNERYAAYGQDLGADSEVRERAANDYDRDLLAQAKALDDLDLRTAPLEQRPFLHNQRREILELAAEIEEFKQRFASRLTLMLTSFRQLFQSATDTARKTPHRG